MPLWREMLEIPTDLAVGGSAATGCSGRSTSGTSACATPGVGATASADAGAAPACVTVGDTCLRSAKSRTRLDGRGANRDSPGDIRSRRDRSSRQNLRPHIWHAGGCAANVRSILQCFRAGAGLLELAAHRRAQAHANRFLIAAEESLMLEGIRGDLAAHHHAGGCGVSAAEKRRLRGGCASLRCPGRC